MRRVLITGLVLAAAVAVVVLATGSGGGSGKPRYWIQLDNAFGLIEGADFKLAGVRAGKIKKLKLDRRNKKALVQVEVDQKPGFSQLRQDVFCETRPQSLIGEYFIDCNPGRSPRKLKPGATIPVRQTASTIPPDLVNNILRLPERERLRIILNEFGTGLAARGQDLNDAIRRGVPALRQTDRLLAILAQQNQTIANLTKDGDAVITALANNRTNVGRFVAEARDTAAASAARQTQLAATWNKLPRFLEELTPTMRELGRVADAQTPALRDLNASAGQLQRFFKDLGPFADASRPSFRSLGDASVVGRQAVRAARPTVTQLRRLTRHTPELGKNLAIVLEDLYDRRRAVEKDPRSPGGQGWNGLEALLGYVFWQSQAINIFDRNGYILKVAAYANECGAYRNAESVKANPDLLQKCASYLGPHQPGVNEPDPSVRNGGATATSARAGDQQRDAQVPDGGQNAGGPAPTPSAGTPSQPSPSKPQQARPPIDLGRTINHVLGNLNVPIPGIDPNKVKQAAQALQNQAQTPSAPQSDAANQLLDYLLS